MEEYAPRFPDYYKSNDDWDLVVDDVLMLEKLEAPPKGSSSASATSRRASA